MSNDTEATLEASRAPDRPSWTIRVLGVYLAGLMTLAALAEAAALGEIVGYAPYDEARYLWYLGIAIAALFILKPMRKDARRTKVPFYDAALAVVGMGTCFYASWHYERILESMADSPPESFAVGLIIVLIVAEGLRRTAGNILFGFMVFFVLFGLIGHHVPGTFQGDEVEIDRLFIYIGLDSNGLVGFPLRVSTTIVITFIYFGTLLGMSGGSSFFTDISAALMGRYRGGSAKIAVTASSIFGSISGSAVSNVVSTGVITIPLMEQAGYRRDQAAAIEAVASTGGQLMPPMMGAAAFLMAEFLEIAYQEVVLAALIPAVLYYVSLFIQADLVAARDGLKPVDEDKILPRMKVLLAGGQYIIPFAVIIVCLFTLNLVPQASALWASVSLIPIGFLLGYKGERMKLTAPIKALSETGSLVVQLIMIGAMAGIVIGVLNTTGLGFAMTQSLVQIADGNLLLVLIMAAIVSIILGMGMPTLGVYLLVATLVAPAMVEVGITPKAAHLFALYFGMLSMITPPVAIAAFAAATVAKSDPMKTAASAVQFGWSAYIVPFMFVVAPELMLDGPLWLISQTAVTAILGVWIVSAGFVGYFSRHLSLLSRLLFVIAGAAMMLPASALSFGIWTDVGGLVLAILLITREKLATRR
ncbi:MAG: TRAP transporter 4TM/12TM fusion protein [Paracoccaceae bacterium]|jgi:TRAP transporter 4TM/12TM fusion protein